MVTSSLYHDIGSLIRRRRRALDLTQAELATRLGISRGALANIETGRQNMLVHQLYRFAAALDVNVHDLLPIPRDMDVLDLGLLTNERPIRGESVKLPMPKGLTREQRAQVTRVFGAAIGRRSNPNDVE